MGIEWAFRCGEYSVTRNRWNACVVDQVTHRLAPAVFRQVNRFCVSSDTKFSSYVHTSTNKLMAHKLTSLTDMPATVSRSRSISGGSESDCFWLKHFQD